jgi:isoleucyl-tRNA synthetase
MTIINKDKELLNDMRSLEGYLKDELNIYEIEYRSDEEKFIRLRAKPNFPLLGKRLGKRMKIFASRISKLTTDEIGYLLENHELEISVDGGKELFSINEIEVLQEGREGSNTISNSKISIDLDCTVTPELKRAGYAREFVNRIQRLRKDLDLSVSDRIELHYNTEDSLKSAIEEHIDYIKNETLSINVSFNETLSGANAEIDGISVDFNIKKLSN